MKKYLEPLYNGIIKENPTFVLMLGMCPTLAVTTSAINGMGMGLTTMVVLIMSNFVISLLRHVIPNRVRIPAYIVIVAKPQWAKAVFFFEGIIIGISGYTLLATPYNYLLGIIGLAIVVIAVLAYLQKLPMSILKYFYR